VVDLLNAVELPSQLLNGTSDERRVSSHEEENTRPRRSLGRGVGLTDHHYVISVNEDSLIRVMILGNGWGTHQSWLLLRHPDHLDLFEGHLQTSGSLSESDFKSGGVGIEPTLTITPVVGLRLHP